MVIILTKYDGLESPMLHTKSRGNRLTGSGAEEFGRLFYHKCPGGHLGHVIKNFNATTHGDFT